jgi:hypothetical protein
MRVRALFGLFEGDPEDVIFAGALSEIHYEMSEEVEYQKLLDGLKATAPHGTTDWREAWIEFDPPDLAPPTVAAITKPATDQLAIQHSPDDREEG